MINYFETIKSALDALYPVICAHKGVSKKSGHNAVVEELRKMNKEWFKDLPANIDYSDPFCRFAYLYGHTAANANLCEIAIRDSTDVCDLIERRAKLKGILKVCAFGGGPGTELLALAKHLTNVRPTGPHLQVKFDLLDRVDEWIESWKALEVEISRILNHHYGAFVNHPFSMSGNIYGKDMTQKHQYLSLPTLFDQDIFFLNYVVSEIGGNSKGISNNAPSFVELMQHAAKSCKSGRKFIITDRDQNNVVSNATELLEACNLDVSKVVKVCTRMDNDEKPDIIFDYAGRDESGKPIHRPRTWWKGVYGSNSNRGAFYVIGTKK
jgi:hypothetical protein